ncbi:nectin-4 [Clupea harengus]|uniref:Nectin-4 n=1 Tax=Clupea harengus TaxID=7950 RepID=A0A6P8GQR8_CLUHA|nr:nectin-4 [Clupea harengus]
MMLSSRITLRLCVYGTLMVCVLGESLLPLISAVPQRTLAEAETRLPCRYSGEDKVVQVGWSRVRANGDIEQIIIYDFTEGVKEFTEFVNKMRFETLKPVKDLTLLILSTEESDEATYSCRITTFPSGTTESKIQLTVWTRPISILEPVVLVEGQSYRQAASCRSVGRPQPRVTWDTDLAGHPQNRSVDARTVSGQFSLHPLRNLNGRQLDCLVWHPTFDTPFRISNRLVVHYPPDVSIGRLKGDWYVGLEDAELNCVSGGNPKPNNFTWSRKGGSLPEGVELTPEGTLKFGRALSQSDDGIYQCTASNSVGSGRAEMEIKVAGSVQKEASVDTFLIIIIGCVAVALVIILVIVVITVNQYHKRKNKRLAMELHERREEISTLSRQASFRRMNSVSTDRYPMDEIMPLRVEGTLRNSLSSLDRPRSRDSRSTMGGAVDTLGRPVIYNTSRRGRDSRMSRDLEREREREDNRHRVESYVRNSSASLFHPPLHPSPTVMDQTAEIVKPVNGSAIPTLEGRLRSAVSTLGRNQAGSTLISMYPPLTDEEEEEEEERVRCLGLEEDESDFLQVTNTNGLENHGSETNSSQMSETLSSPYEQSNGSLRIKTRPNGSLLPPPMPLLQKAHVV